MPPFNQNKPQDQENHDPKPVCKCGTRMMYLDGHFCPECEFANVFPDLMRRSPVSDCPFGFGAEERKGVTNNCENL